MCYQMCLSFGPEGNKVNTAFKDGHCLVVWESRGVLIGKKCQMKVISGCLY